MYKILTKEQENQCKATGAKLIAVKLAVRENLGWTVDEIAEHCKSDKQRFNNVIANLLRGGSYKTLPEIDKWILRLEKALATGDGSARKRKGSEELQKAANQPAPVQEEPKLKGIVVELHENNLSTSLVGEEGYEIPGEHLLITRTANSFKMYTVKPTTVDPRVQYRETQKDQEIEQLKIRNETLEMQICEYQKWAEAAKVFYQGLGMNIPGTVSGAIKTIPVNAVLRNGERPGLVSAHSD